MKKRFGILLSTLLIPAGLFAQTIQEGQKFLDLEQYTKAENVFTTLANTNATAENHYFLGTYYLRVEEIDKAKKQFEAGLAKDPKYALNLVGLGAVNIAQGKKAQAADFFNQAIVLTKSKNAEVFYEIGKSYVIYETKDGPEAIKALENATKLNPKNPEYFLRLGDAYLLMNDGTKAIYNYETKALPLNPNLAKTYLKIGQLMERARNYNEAAAKYKEGIAKEETYWPAYRELGELYDRARRSKEGLSYYRRYIKETEASPIALTKYADFLIKAQEWDEALTTLKAVEAKAPKARIYRGLAYVQVEKELYDDAKASYEKFLAKKEAEKVDFMANDHRYHAKIIIGTKGDSSLAVNKALEAFALDTTDVTALKDLGKIFTDAKDLGRSAKVLAALDSLGKADASDLLNLGRTYHNLKQFDKADTSFAKLNQIAPTFGTGWYWRAFNATKLDPKSENWLAQPHYEEFVNVTWAEKDKFKPFLTPSIRYLISYYLIGKADKENTQKFANMLLELDPNNKDAKDALAHDFSKPAAKKPAGKK